MSTASDTLSLLQEKNLVTVITMPQEIDGTASPILPSPITPQESMTALRIFKEPSETPNTPEVVSLRLVSVPIPKPAPGTVLVRIHAAAINPSDAANAAGYFPYTTFPRVPGRDFAGVVVAGPSHLQSQRVFGTSGRDMSFITDGASAEYCVIPEGGVVPMPPDLTFAQAATIGVPWTTAWLTIERTHTKPSDTVLVIGASGAVGSAACQLARAKGCRVITAARRATADIDLRVDPKLETVKALTGGLGPSVIIDTVGDPHLMARALDVLAPRGRLSYISAPKSYNAVFSFDMRKIYRSEKVIVGCNSLGYSIEEMGDILRELAPRFGKQGPYTAPDPSELVEVKLAEVALDAYKNVKTTAEAIDSCESGKDGATRANSKYVITME